MPRMIDSTLFSALALVAMMAAPLAMPQSLAHANGINWNLLYGNPGNLGGYLGRALPPPVYVIVPVQPDGDDQVYSTRPKHRFYRHQAHWLLHREHQHRHAHEHPEYVHREIYRQGRGAHDRGDD